MKLLKQAFGLAILIAITAAGLALVPAPAGPPLAARQGPPLTSAKVWGYQLQGAHAALIAPDIDLIVIDHARETSATDLLTAADVDAFRARPGRPPRIVLAYMSVGEAERYRFYWRRWWSSNVYLGMFKPSWLARENKEWKGNYLVRYWDPSWQKVMFDPARSMLDHVWHKIFSEPPAYLDSILNAGFDGVYLDRVDAFGEWEKSRPSAEADMSTFVQKMSSYAKAQRPGFLVVPQNGEELAAKRDYRQAIDGLAKEDLMFGVQTAETANDRDETKRSAEFLRKVQADGKPVFVVEYLRDLKKRDIARARAKELGFTLTFADRELNRAPELLPTTPVLPTQPIGVSPSVTPKTQP